MDQQDLKNEREKRIYTDEDLNLNEGKVTSTKQENEDGEYVDSKEEEKHNEDMKCLYNGEEKELNEDAEFMQNKEESEPTEEVEYVYSEEEEDHDTTAKDLLMTYYEIVESWCLNDQAISQHSSRHHIRIIRIGLDLNKIENNKSSFFPYHPNYHLLGCNEQIYGLNSPLLLKVSVIVEPQSFIFKALSVETPGDFFQLNQILLRRLNNKIGSSNLPFDEFLFLIRRTIESLTEFCSVCDAFIDAKDHKRISGLNKGNRNLSICTKELCLFSRTTLQVGQSLEHICSTDPSLVKFVMELFGHSIETLSCESTDSSFKKFTPFSRRPNSAEIVLEDVSLSSWKDFHILAETGPAIKDQAISLYKLWKNMPSNKNELFRYTESLKHYLDSKDPSLYSLLNYIVLSFLMDVKKTSILEGLLPEFDTYLFQVKQTFANSNILHEFEKLKDRHGSHLLFHGSDASNWYSIVKRGLKIMSKTPRMRHGATFGTGIYLTENLATALTYSGSLGVVALCEVVKIDRFQRRQGNCYVVDDERCIRIRALLWRRFISKPSTNFYPSSSSLPQDIFEKADEEVSHQKLNIKPEHTLFSNGYDKMDEVNLIETVPPNNALSILQEIIESVAYSKLPLNKVQGIQAHFRFLQDLTIRYRISLLDQAKRTLPNNGLWHSPNAVRMKTGRWNVEEIQGSFHSNYVKEYTKNPDDYSMEQMLNYIYNSWTISYLLAKEDNQLGLYFYFGGMTEGLCIEGKTNTLHRNFITYQKTRYNMYLGLSAQHEIFRRVGEVAQAKSFWINGSPPTRLDYEQELQSIKQNVEEGISYFDMLGIL